MNKAFFRSQNCKALSRSEERILFSLFWWFARRWWWWCLSIENTEINKRNRVRYRCLDKVKWKLLWSSAWLMINCLYEKPCTREGAGNPSSGCRNVLSGLYFFLYVCDRKIFRFLPKTFLTQLFLMHHGVFFVNVLSC